MNSLSIQLFAFVCLWMIIPWQGLQAQQNRAESRQTSEVEGRVLEQEQIRPAFRAEPIVHRIDARRGEDIPIEFTLLSSGRPTRLLIKPIAITQREDGVIAVDESVPAPTAIRLEGPQVVSMESGDDHVIKGRVRVPLTQSTFHSFGVLVRDLGLEEDDPRRNSDDNQIRFGVRFVTQYLLRADITVLGVRAERIQDLEFETVELAEQDGFAKIQSYLLNPTDSPMSIQVKCQLQRPNGSGGNPVFGIGMPVRAHLSEPEKHQIKILAKTRLRLEDVIPHPLSVGRYEAHFTVYDGRRIGKKAVLPVDVDLLEFPAQNRNLIAVTDGVTAEPAQIELSLDRGGRRLVPLKLTNHSQDPITLSFAAFGQDGQPTTFVDVRPERATIRGGGKRNVLLMLKSTSDLAEHQYGHLKIQPVSPNQEEANGEMIKLAIISRSESGPKLEFGEMVWNESGKTPALVLPVSNKGGKHLPLRSTMTVTSIDGASMQIPAGFGRWLLPGEDDKFRFRFKTLPPPGQYTVKLMIELGPDQDPIQSTSTIQFSASPGAGTSE